MPSRCFRRGLRQGAQLICTEYTPGDRKSTALRKGISNMLYSPPGPEVKDTQDDML